MLQRIFVVLALTFKEAIRRRLILILVGGGVLFMGGGAGCVRLFQGALELGIDSTQQQMETQLRREGVSEEEILLRLQKLQSDRQLLEKEAGKHLKRVLLISSFCMISFWLFLIGGVFTPFLAMNDFQSRTHVMILSRPVQRWEYLAGKYVAIMAMLLLNLGILLGSFHLFFYLSVGEFGTEIWRGFLHLEALALFVTMMMLFALLFGRLPAVFLSLLVAGLGMVPAFVLVSDNLRHTDSFWKAVVYGISYGLPQYSVNFFYTLGEVMDLPGLENTLKPAGNQIGFYSLFINAAWIGFFWICMLTLFQKRDMET